MKGNPMITELSFTNFKPWQSVDKMRLAPITGLFGTHSSGKTSILQLLLMLKQTVESSDRAEHFVALSEAGLHIKFLCPQQVCPRK